MRRIPALIAALLVTLALASCSEEVPAEESSPTVDDSLVADEFIRSPDPETEAAEAEEPASPEAPIPTVVEELWITEHWEIEEVYGGVDPCAGWIDESGYSQDSEVFSCGPPVSGATACMLGDDERVFCISDARTRHAIVFDSPHAADPATEPEYGEWPPTPLYVELDDGVICYPLSHDHKPHFEEYSSWFDCEDGSELLTVETSDGTFLRDETWYCFRSVDKAAPVKTAITRVTFAGR